MTQTPLTVGNPAPPFTLLDQDGTSVSLGDLAGRWVVLYFFPKNDTPGCTTEACEFNGALDQFQQLEAVVLGCSPDSPASHRRFIEKHHLGLRLLSDPDHQATAAYGAWGEKKMYGRTTQGVIRSTVIIDPEGNLAAHWPKVRAAGHAAAVREKLSLLRSD